MTKAGDVYRRARGFTSEKPSNFGWVIEGKLAGSGTVLWHARELLAAGKINYDEFLEMVASSAPSAGHCNTMGTATSMNSMA